jgi:uncharacterized membrane protein YecN with MAPEG domain
MIAPITTIATIILAILYVVLTVRVINARQASGVSLGTGDDTNLTRRIRGQANFTENVPIALLVMAVAEMQSVSLFPSAFTIALALTAFVFVVGRLMHGYAFSFSEHWQLGRSGGMMLTVLSMIALIALALLALVA